MTGCRFFIPIVAACLAWAGAPAWGQSSADVPLPEEQAVESAENSLGGWGGYPWYDGAADKRDVRLVPVVPFAAPPAPVERSAWEWPSWIQSFLNWLGEVLRSIWDFFAFIRNHPILWPLFVFVMTVLVVGLVIYLIHRNFRFQSPASAAGKAKTTAKVRAEIDRIEALPFKVDTPLGDLLSEAQRLYAAGDYRGAVIYYYSYQLVELDRHHKIRLTRGKTNRQYLREVRQRQEIAGLLENTMVAFEEVFFGNHDLPRSRFEECWEQRGEFARWLTA